MEEDTQGQVENVGAAPGAATFLRRRKLSRQMVMQFLYQAELNGTWEADDELLTEFKELLFTAFMDDEDIEDAPLPEDIAEAWRYAKKLLRGCLPMHEELDALIAAAADNWAMNRISMADKQIMRLACYEITQKPGKVTPATAINEAVELAKRFGAGESPKFVNGVLDKVKRNTNN